MNDKKLYYVDTKVETFIREWYYADSDKDAIERAKEVDYEPINFEVLHDCTYYPKDEANEGYIEVYNSDHKLIYNNLW